MIRLIVIAGMLLRAIASASAQTTLRVGDQKGNSQAVMEAAGVLKDVPVNSSEHFDFVLSFDSYKDIMAWGTGTNGVWNPEPF